MMKRLLSAVLVLVMMVSMLPVVSADEGDSESQNSAIAYDTDGGFGSDGLAVRDISAPQNFTIKYDFGGVFKSNELTIHNISTKLTEEITNGFFRFNSYSDASAGFVVGTRASANLNGVDLYEGKSFSFDVYVPVAGTYTMKGYYAKYTRGGEVEVYVNDAETAVGSYNCYGTAKTNPYPNETDQFTISDISLHKGWNKIKFSTESAGKRGTIRTFSLVLGDGSGTVVMKSAASIDKTKLPFGETAKITVTNFLSDVSEEEDATVSFESSNPDVATVDKHGTITPQGTGYAEITVSGGAKNISETFGIYAGDIEFSGVMVNYDVCSVIVDKKISDVGELTEEVTRGFFRGNSEKSSESGINFVTNRDTLTDNVIEITDASLVLDVYVPKAGIYEMKGTHPRFKSGGVVDVYVNGAEKKAGSYDCSGDKGEDSCGNDAEFTIMNVDMHEGWNSIEFKASTAGKIGAVKSFTLDGGTDTVVMKSSASVDKTELRIGETAQITITNVISDGSEEEDTTVSFESLNPDVATVDGNGKITAQGAGEADIMVSGGAKDISESIHVYVNNVRMSGITVKYDVCSSIVNNKISKVSALTEEVTRGFFRGNSEKSSGKGITFVTSRGTLTNNCIELREASIVLDVYAPKAGAYDMNGTRPRFQKGDLVDVYVYGEDGTEKKVGSYDCYDGTVTQTSSYGNEAAFTIENIELKEGWNSIKFTSSTSGKVGTVKNFTLNGGPGSVPISATISTNKTDVEVAEEAQITTSVYMSAGETVVDNTVEYSIEDGSIATIDATGVVTGKAIGTTTVYARGGMIEDTDLQIDINVYVAEIGKNEYIYDMTPEGVPEETLVSTMTYEKTGDTWQYFGNKSNNVNFMKVMPSFDYLYLSSYGGSNAWVALKIKVPEAGKYGVNLAYGARKLGASQVGMYILPGDTSRSGIEEMTAMGKGLITDNINCYTPSSEINKASERYIGTYNFEAPGEYLVVYKMLSRESNTTIYMGNIRLDPENILSELNLSIDKTEIKWSEEIKLTAIARKLDKSIMDSDECKISYVSSDKKIASVDANGNIRGTGDGEVTITVTATDGFRTITKKVNLRVVDDTAVEETSVDVSDRMYQREASTFGFTVRTGSGIVYKLPLEEVTYSVVPEGMVTISNGIITVAPDALGEVTITATAPFRGEIHSFEKTIEIIADEKSGPTFYTYEMRENALKNIEKYDWAEKERDSVVKNADKSLKVYDLYFLQMTGEGIPRSRQVGLTDDPDYIYCRYCGSDIVTKYGSGGSLGWDTDVLGRPWKIKCPDCARVFPSNDFESFHKLGLKEDGTWDRQKALDAHRAMLIEKGLLVDNGKPAPTKERSDEWYAYYGYGVKGGYLYNDLYAELRTPTSDKYNKDPFKKDKNGDYYDIDGNRWGVDDGYGYYTGRKSRTNDENHCYIAYYNYYMWEEVKTKISDFTKAYLYTGDPKYARAGALLLDRAAELWPSFDYNKWCQPSRIYMVTDGTWGHGKIVGRINDCLYAKTYVQAADAFYPILTDEEFLNKITQRDPEKSSSVKIWESWEKNILLETWEGMKRGQIKGNFGMHQEALAAAAIVLDEEPEKTEMLRWLYAPDTGDNYANITGGDVSATLCNEVDRDGMSYESSPYYTFIWLSRLYGMADTLALYDGEEEFSTYEHPKFAKMYTAALRLTVTEDHHVQIGDAGSVAGVEFFQSVEIWKNAFKNLKDTQYGKELAQFLWLRNGKTTEGLRYGIFDDDPERLEREVAALIDEDYKQESDMMSGYGFAILRAGSSHSSSNGATTSNNLRDFWIHFGRTDAAHAHQDTLGIGVEAFGLNLSPEMGYPESSGGAGSDHSDGWVGATISHNTVVVDGISSQAILSGYPRHFDSTENVKLFDVDAAKAYANTKDYRRSLVMVKVNDEVSYGIDFFHVLGGNKHTYSFHALSEKAIGAEGLDLVHDEVVKDENGNDIVGTYAGPDVPLGSDFGGNYPRGYTWMYDVRRDKKPEKNFSVDFEITDYRKTLHNSEGIHLRITQLNEFVPNEVAITKGRIPLKSDNKQLPEGLEYLVVQREGENLDTLFTTVIEPYRKARYIESIEVLDIDGVDASDNSVRALKVTHSGKERADYIIYSTDNSKSFIVRDTDGSVALTFRGFVGVVTKNEKGAVTYRYVNDGDDILGATNKPGAFTGEVKDFQKDEKDADGNYIDENYIDVVFDGEVDLDEIVGRYVHVDNGGSTTKNNFNGVYFIEDVIDNREADGTVRLDIGSVTLINSYKDVNAPELGFNYDISEGLGFVIPMSYDEDFSPVFDAVSNDIATSVGSMVSVTVNAESPVEENPPEITYIGTTLPRGASFDSETGTFSWKPTMTQLGENHVAITARDADGRESTIHFNIDVFGSTSGGGGGGGGGMDIPSKDDEPKEEPKEEPKDEPTTEEPKVDDKEDVGDGVLNVPSEKGFTDIANYAWAEDAINALADAGIIKGTSETTFAPSNNITRADYALLLVRAFKLESDQTENFADVAASDYFARELAIARNTGIIGGIGDNKYAPKNTITRQDMMVILYRALTKMGVELTAKEGIDATSFADYDDVADYAKEAVTALVNAGLVNGKSGNIAGSDKTTRAEVAVLLKRILDYIG